VQAIKAGVLEIADLFAVNKADREGADRTVLVLQMMQGLAPAPTGHHRATAGSALPQPGPQEDGSWLPPILKTVATRGDGVEALREWIERHAAYLRALDGWSRREAARAATELERILRDRLLAHLLAALPADRLAQMVTAIVRREIDPYTAAEQLLTQAV